MSTNNLINNIQVVSRDELTELIQYLKTTDINIDNYRVRLRDDTSNSHKHCLLARLLKEYHNKSIYIKSSQSGNICYDVFINCNNIVTIDDFYRLLDNLVIKYDEYQIIHSRLFNSGKIKPTTQSVRRYKIKQLFKNEYNN